MKEIRWHGRGGQGVVIASRLLAAAFTREGKSAVALPKFGAERRGAPVVSFTKVNDEPIREKTQIYFPDCLIVIDPRLIRSIDVFAGLQQGGILVIDSPTKVIEQFHSNLCIIGSVDATKIALTETAKHITNTCMLGAFARTTGWVKLESILATLEEYFTGSGLQENIRCAQRGYQETQVTRF